MTKTIPFRLHTAHIFHPVLFTPAQLRQVLSCYSEGVLTRGWRDYALDSAPGQTVFSVVERIGGKSGTAVLCSISRQKPQKSTDAAYYRVFYRDALLHRTDSFLEALTVFSMIDARKGAPDSKTLKKILKDMM